MESLGLEFRAEVARYLRREIDIAALSDWLTSAAWNIEARATGDVAALYREAELLLSEFSHGDWDEREFRKKLVSAMAYDIADLPGASIVGQSSTATAVTFLTGVILGAPRLEFVDIRFEEASL